VLCGKVSIFGSVNVNKGGHYWKNANTGFKGSLTQRGTLHVGKKEDCNRRNLESPPATEVTATDSSAENREMVMVAGK
jgi:hypothetical protein